MSVRAQAVEQNITFTLLLSWLIQCKQRAAVD